MVDLLKEDAKHIARDHLSILRRSIDTQLSSLSHHRSNIKYLAQGANKNQHTGQPAN
uniref:Uncharacterized protein n=1 Tax=Arundo donax TaxID=35708 RepID=A0A0A9GRR1_ARUDO